jgi:hypothetical protein
MLRVPAGLKAGAWYVLACADATDAVSERRESDNCRASRSTVALQAQTGPEIPPLP